MGVRIRSTAVGSWPSASSCDRNRANLADDPISPIGPRWSSRMAASHRATSSAWSWVITSTCVPGGSSASTSSGSTGTGWTCTAATASASGPSASADRCSGAGVDQVQVEVVAGQDASELETDVADPEDRDARHHGQRLQQHRHLAAAALHAVLRSAPCRTGGSRTTRGLVSPASSRARARRTASASRLPPPTEPVVAVAETTILAPASRGAWPRTSVDRDEHAGLAGGAEVGHRLPPRRHTRTPDRTRSSAQ